MFTRQVQVNTNTSLWPPFWRCCSQNMKVFQTDFPGCFKLSCWLSLFFISSEGALVKPEEMYKRFGFPNRISIIPLLLMFHWNINKSGTLFHTCQRYFTPVGPELKWSYIQKAEKLAETTFQLRKIGGKSAYSETTKFRRKKCVNHKNVVNLVTK